MQESEPLGTDGTTAIQRAAPTGLKRRSLLLMILLTIATLGLYVPLWFLRRRAALNRLDSPRKLQRWPFMVAVVRLAVAILFVFQAFFTKDILEDHLAGPDDALSNSITVERVKRSALRTFFFGAFYLQHIINRHFAVIRA